MRILGVGEIVFDQFVFLDRYPIEGEKIISSSFIETVGGAVALEMIFFSRLKTKPLFITSLSDDYEGRKIIYELKKQKINLIINYQTKTKKNIVLINKKNGSRTIIKGFQENKLIYDIDKKLIKEADIIFLDRHQNHLFEKIKTLKNKDSLLIYDPSVDCSLRNLRILKQLEIIIVSAELTKKISPYFKEFPKKLNLQDNQILIITAGSKGVYWIKNKKVFHLPALKKNIVDTTGAGDIFRAAFAYFYQLTSSLEKSILFANLIAYYQCQRPGSGSAVPSSSLIKNIFLKVKNINHFSCFKVYAQ